MFRSFAASDFALSYGVRLCGARVWRGTPASGGGKFVFSGAEFSKIPPSAATVTH